jgi:hypothetical protein
MPSGLLVAIAAHTRPRIASTGRPSSSLLKFPCSSLNPPHRRRATQPCCRRPTGCRSGRTGAPRRQPAATPFPTRPRQATNPSKVSHRPGQSLRPSPAAAGRQSHRRRGPDPPGDYIAVIAIFRG